MIAFYVVSVLWLVTLAAWQYREKQNAKERMETLKLFRAHSLTEYSTAEKPRGGQTNFMQASINRAYHDADGDDDE